MMNKPKSFIVLYGGKFIRAYHEEDVDNLIAKKDAELSMLKRALYKASANWANCKACILECFGNRLYAKKWENMIHKCRAKAEEYK